MTVYERRMLVREMRAERLAQNDPMRPARGIGNALILSVAFWSALIWWLAC